MRHERNILIHSCFETFLIFVTSTTQKSIGVRAGERGGIPGCSCLPTNAVERLG